MSSPTVWQALALAGDAHAAARRRLTEAEQELASARQRLADAERDLIIARNDLDLTQQSARKALNAAQADLAKNGVAGPTKP